jgi:hypothetical protein
VCKTFFVVAQGDGVPDDSYHVYLGDAQSLLGTGATDDECDDHASQAASLS